MTLAILLAMALGANLGFGVAKRMNPGVAQLSEQLDQCRVSAADGDLYEASLLKQLSQCRGTPRMVARPDGAVLAGAAE